MEGFQYQARATLRRHQSQHRGNHGAVTMAPKIRFLDAKRLEECQRFARGPAVKIKRQLSIDSRGMSVAGTVGDQDAKLVFESCDLPVEGIKTVSPAAMQDDERLAAAEFPVMDDDGTDAGRVRGMR